MMWRTGRDAAGVLTERMPVGDGPSDGMEDVSCDGGSKTVAWAIVAWETVAWVPAILGMLTRPSPGKHCLRSWGRKSVALRFREEASGRQGARPPVRRASWWFRCRWRGRG